MPDDSEHPSDSGDWGVLQYPAHMFDPADLLNFTELNGFQQDWKGLGLDVDVDLACLQIEIMIDPTAGAVIRGSGSLRKLRFAPPNWNMGKRGAIRVLYVHFPTFGHVLLVAAYPKNEDRGLSPRGLRRIKELIEEQERILHERYFAS